MDELGTGFEAAGTRRWSASLRESPRRRSGCVWCGSAATGRRARSGPCTTRAAASRPSSAPRRRGSVEVRDRMVSGLRRRLLGDVPSFKAEGALVAAYNRLAKASDRPAALVFEAVDAADEATLTALRRILGRPGWLKLPLVLGFREPDPSKLSGAAVSLLEVVRATCGDEAILRRAPPADGAGRPESRGPGPDAAAGGRARAARGRHRGIGLRGQPRRGAARARGARRPRPRAARRRRGGARRGHGRGSHVPARAHARRAARLHPALAHDRLAPPARGAARRLRRRGRAREDRSPRGPRRPRGRSRRWPRR